MCIRASVNRDGINLSIQTVSECFTKVKRCFEDRSKVARGKTERRASSSPKKKKKNKKKN